MIDIDPKKLCMAILAQAVHDWLHDPQKKYREELRLFFFDRGEMGKMFRWCCHVLDISPQYINKNIDKWAENEREYRLSLRKLKHKDANKEAK